MTKDLVPALTQAVHTGTSLAPAALVIARIEFPRLDPAPYLQRLDALGAAALRAVEESVAATGDTSTASRVSALNNFFFGEMHFSGSNDYEDPRNSCLNEVLDRRTGIPISLAVIYLEVARRAVAREVILALEVLGVVALLEALGIAPDGADHRGPRLLDHEDAALALVHRVAGLVHDLGEDAGQRRLA
jgi:hypothetical protein